MELEAKVRHKKTYSECQGALSNIGDALYVIGGKWKLRVIISIREGNCRFNEIQRSVQGISARVLSNELKELELNGFVKRTVHTDTPVVVEYNVTEYANSLDEVLNALESWGAKHRDKLKAER
ncbi:helix-turn-helix domain-containing protein [Pedobacter sp. MC2016-15]|uniref:winged helix-turn-helix transcriptional regulator n=1 Tax=Pedobacter sp. MC2016-15 TaxID=2994473 RepID=UPI00224690A4|nr:helix-turn-helix domain-containing protein [Pedobacter sp. MC2016-15]MCX2477747.1 helix-turn-helix domain-containing protein [Pedobacter sp. MC2016-15]